MTSRLRILYFERLPEAVERVRTALALEHLPCEVIWVDSPGAFASALAEAWSYDLLFACHAGEALEAARRLAPILPLIVLAESGGGPLPEGIKDQVAPGDLSRLGAVVRRALAEARHGAGEREALAANARLAALLRATLEATADGILVLDLAGRVTAYNRTFLSLCGIPEYVMAPMTTERVLQFIADHFQDPEAFLDEVRRQGDGPGQESSGRMKTEAGRILEQAGRPHRVGGRTVGRILSLRDVTERERSASRLRQMAAGDQLLVDAAAAGEVVLWSMTKDLLLISDFAAALLGIPTQDGAMAFAELEALFHPEDLERFRRALEHPEDAPFEARLKGIDGWVWTRWNLRKAEGGGYHGVFYEVGRQRALQEQLAERRRAEWLGALAAKLAHDLRSPVQTLGRHLDALATIGADAVPAHLEACARAAGSLEAILAQLSAAPFTEAAAGFQLDLNELVERLGPWAETALGPGPELRREPGTGLPALPWPPARLEPVLMNLVLNARDALGGSGTVTIRTGTAPPPDRSLFLEVEDDGPGIAPLALDRIFQPGFTTRPGAQGLGLAVVRRIVETCGGSVQVDTGPMRGTRIRVLLPAPDGSAP